MSAYNYETFDGYVESGTDTAEFAAFPKMLHATERAPDGTMTRLSDGAEVRLGDLWRSKPVVLEFGSYT